MPRPRRKPAVRSSPLSLHESMAEARLTAHGGQRMAAEGPLAPAGRSGTAQHVVPPQAGIKVSRAAGERSRVVRGWRGAAGGGIPAGVVRPCGGAAATRRFPAASLDSHLRGKDALHGRGCEASAGAVRRWVSRLDTRGASRRDRPIPSARASGSCRATVSTPRNKLRSQTSSTDMSIGLPALDTTSRPDGDAAGPMRSGCRSAVSCRGRRDRCRTGGSAGRSAGRPAAPRGRSA